MAFRVLKVGVAPFGNRISRRVGAFSALPSGRGRMTRPRYRPPCPGRCVCRRITTGAQRARAERLIKANGPIGQGKQKRIVFTSARLIGSRAAVKFDDATFHCAAFLMGWQMTRFVLLFLPAYTDVPRVQLVLGRNLSPDHIREGIDVYFDCHVEARPSAVRLVWRHQVRAAGLPHQRRDGRGRRRPTGACLLRDARAR